MTIVIQTIDFQWPTCWLIAVHENFINHFIRFTISNLCLVFCKIIKHFMLKRIEALELETQHVILSHLYLRLIYTLAILE